MNIPKKNAPTKEIRGKALKTSFPTGTSPTTKPFTGTKGAIHGVAKINGNNLPWTNRQK
jgi:hypothetical protein